MKTRSQVTSLYYPRVMQGSKSSSEKSWWQCIGVFRMYVCCKLRTAKGRELCVTNCGLYPCLHADRSESTAQDMRVFCVFPPDLECTKPFFVFHMFLPVIPSHLTTRLKCWLNLVEFERSRLMLDTPSGIYTAHLYQQTGSEIPCSNKHAGYLAEWSGCRSSARDPEDPPTPIVTFLHRI